MRSIPPARATPSAERFLRNGCAAAIRIRQRRMPISLPRCRLSGEARWRRSHGEPRSKHIWRQSGRHDEGFEPMTQLTNPSSAHGIELFARRPVIPVLTLDDPDQAIELARALTAGGLDVLEVTLRTAGAVEAIRAIARDVPEVIVGAGTVLDASQA